MSTSAVAQEMTADDAASSVADRCSLAKALVALSTGVRSEAAMAARDTAALQRVRRWTSRIAEGWVCCLLAAMAGRG